MEKWQISPDLSQKLDGLLQAAGAKNREGKVAESLELGQAAWELLPPPQEEWDFYPQIMARSMATKCAAIGDAISTKKWIEITYRMYDDPEHRDHFVLMPEGRALHQLGLYDEAYGLFAKVYEVFGRQGFSGEDAPYLEFYLKERAKGQN
ncbi:hypothetical protein [Rhizobium oryzicola]|uniref:Tetratricopeptide repeat protein n=1 Tax=Rhizobium oryzicola TaxID=1232668 RepID=A0ABT8SXA4_9HYPH|nr:hypothetical protein [Rhizobium oryzicola]MDO1583074.1 hypothetical protein [Rhizobium oryzicola]